MFINETEQKTITAVKGEQMLVSSETVADLNAARMESSQNTSGMVWYNCSTVDGIITTNSPVQVEIGGDITRQLNNQVQIYGNLQTVAGQPQQIIVAHQPISESSVQLSPIKIPKPRIKHSNGERVPCPQCGKTFSCNANLRDHLRLHSGEKPFKCPECNMEFAQRSNWRLHRRVHTGERPYMCGICGKTFARSSHLPGHMRVHTGEKPFKCRCCNSTFASGQALKNHMRTHTGEKPFVCEHCSTAFTHSSSLSSHKKRCTGEKRKRGRPIGTGQRISKRKCTGKGRGRPKKKSRYFRRSRRKFDESVSEDGDKKVKEEFYVEVQLNPSFKEEDEFSSDYELSGQTTFNNTSCYNTENSQIAVVITETELNIQNENQKGTIVSVAGCAINQDPLDIASDQPVQHTAFQTNENKFKGMIE